MAKSFKKSTNILMKSCLLLKFIRWSNLRFKRKRAKLGLMSVKDKPYNFVNWVCNILFDFIVRYNGVQFFFTILYVLSSQSRQ